MKTIEDSVLNVSIRGMNTTTVIKTNTVNGIEYTINHTLSKKRQLSLSLEKPQDRTRNN